MRCRNEKRELVASATSANVYLFVYGSLSIGKIYGFCAFFVSNFLSFFSSLFPCVFFTYCDDVRMRFKEYNTLFSVGRG